MSNDPLLQLMETFNLIGVLLAFAIFTRLAIKGKSLGSFRFQLSLFILVWVIAELPHIASTLNLVSTEGYETFGLTFHMLSMTAFAFFLGAKSYNFLRTTNITTTLTAENIAIPNPKEGFHS